MLEATTKSWATFRGATVEVPTTNEADTKVLAERVRLQDKPESDEHPVHDAKYERA